MTYYIKRETNLPHKYTVINNGSLYWTTKETATACTYEKAMNIIQQVGFKCDLEGVEYGSKI